MTDIGRFRENNEDAYYGDDELFIVSDGMGGHEGGECASNIVVTLVPYLVKSQFHSRRPNDHEEIRAILRASIREASSWTRSCAARAPILTGMGATIVAILILDDYAHIAHLGDSRAYLLRQGVLGQLTNDQSFVSLLIRRGEISPEEAEFHPAKGQLWGCVGMEGEVCTESQTLRLRPADRLLLCSDGLTDVLSDYDISTLLDTHDDPDRACDALTAVANAGGGPDNITTLVIDNPIPMT